MPDRIMTQTDLARRQSWVEEISRLSGNFGADTARLETELQEEFRREGLPCLMAHLRLCGAIPEHYGHDSSAEKLYSKYTDILISRGFAQLGLTSLVLTERADAADVECVTGQYSFVADAKAFRLSRTAKNQKDFKVQAMDGWKRGKPYAMVVCPIYQLPSRTSQIYKQAITRSVCVFSYSHLVLMMRARQHLGTALTLDLLMQVFRTVASLNPSKDSVAYWLAVNRTLLAAHDEIHDIWREEKQASNESIELAKEEALAYLSRERERIMLLSREDAIREVIVAHKLENRARAIRRVADNGILNLE